MRTQALGGRQGAVALGLSGDARLLKLFDHAYGSIAVSGGAGHVRPVGLDLARQGVDHLLRLGHIGRGLNDGLAADRITAGAFAPGIAGIGFALWKHAALAGADVEHDGIDGKDGGSGHEKPPVGVLGVGEWGKVSGGTLKAPPSL